MRHDDAMGDGAMPREEAIEVQLPLEPPLKNRDREDSLWGEPAIRDVNSFSLLLTQQGKRRKDGTSMVVSARDWP